MNDYLWVASSRSALVKERQKAAFVDLAPEAGGRLQTIIIDDIMAEWLALEPYAVR